ncbi:MAG TPA: lipopolysaccharide biosynthesis protein [Polyangiaceae bacterium]|nr:lipopolysaccharide biosynthesis protein [Polyangiaceae bacterium]
MSVERQAAAGLKWGSIAKLGGQVVSWAVTLAVFRLLSPEDYGLMALSMVLLSIVAGVAEFGLGSSLIQMPKLDARDMARVGGALAMLNIGCGLAVALGAPVFAKLLGDIRLSPLLRVLSLQFLLTAIESVPLSLAQRNMDFKRLAGIELAATLLGSLVTLLLAWLGGGVWALVIGNLAGAALRTLLYVALNGFTWPSFNFRGIGPHLRFGGAVTITRFLWQLTSQADLLIAGRVLTREAIGFYSVSMHLATLPMTKVMGILNQVAFPAVARLQDELPRLRQRLVDALRLLALAAVPGMWGISSIAAEFVDVVLGERWRDSIVPLQVVSFVAPLRMLGMVLATALTGVGRADLELRNTIVGAIVLPSAFFVGAQWGLDGLAFSWCCAVPIVLAMNFPRTLGALGMSCGDLMAATRGPIAAGIAMYAAVTLARRPLSELDELTRLLILIPVGAAAYLCVVQLMDRTIWSVARKFAAAVRG